MNYLKAYCNLIRKAQKRIPPEGYTEGHHIFPKSIYGENDSIVKLTAKEHYIAHALLEKVFIKRYGKKDQRTIKMIHAFYCMNTVSRKNYYNSYLYESSRIRASEILKTNQHRKGKKLSPEHIQKIVEANSGKQRSEEVKRKISESNKGKKMSDEARAKMSLAKRGKPIPPEQRAKMIAGIQNKLSGKKRVFTDEHKKKMSEAAKKRYQEGKFSQLNRTGKIPWNKGIPRTEEVKQKLSESQKKRHRLNKEKD